MKKYAFLLAFSFWVIGCVSSSKKGEVTATGTVEATESSIAAQVPGRILRMNFEEGSLVRQGDTLAEIDHRSLAGQVEQAKAALVMAKQQYDLLVAGARSEDLKVGQEGVKQATANFDLAKLAFERTSKLYAARSVPQSRMDDARAQYDVAQAQLKSARQTLEKLRHYARPEELRSASARVDQAKAALDNATIAFDHSYVTAPFGGTVLDKLQEPGDFANIGTPLYTIANLKTMKMTVYINEVDLARVRLGNKARVVLDGMPNHPFSGKVIYISPTAEFTPKNVETKQDRIKLVFAVKLAIANHEGYLKAGLPADATIYTN